MRYARIEKGEVVNVEEWEKAPSKDYIMSQDANIGDLFDGKNFSRPQEEKTEEPIEEDEEVLVQKADRLLAAYAEKYLDGVENKDSIPAEVKQAYEIKKGK